MKKAIIIVLLGLAGGYLSTIIGCSAVNNVFEDKTVEYDSLEQFLNGRPNEGGKFTGKEALEEIANKSMGKKMEAGQTSSNEENEQAIEDAKNVSSIMRIPGSLFGIVANPHPNKTLTIKIMRKEGGIDNQVLLPKHVKEIFLPPGGFDIKYILGNKEWEANDYEVTILKSTDYPIPKGWKYEKLQMNSMTEHDEIYKTPADISLTIHFGFVGPDF